MKRILILLLVMSVGLNVSLLVHRLAGGVRSPAGDFHGGRHWPAAGDTQSWHDRIERRTGHMSRHLGLDTQQHQAFRQLHRQAARDVLQHRQDLETHRREIRHLVMEDPLNPAAVRAAIADLGRRQAVMDSLIAEKLLQEMELLAPEQRVKLLGMLDWYQEGRPGPRGHGSGQRPRGYHRSGGTHER